MYSENADEVCTAADLALAETLATSLSELLQTPPVAESRQGLSQARDYICARLENLDFSISIHDELEGEPILIAIRERGPMWVGCAGHYDIEPAGEGWTVEPYSVTRRDGRLYARGIGDNLGPLLLRLEAVAAVERSPSIVFVLQGEEEIGSPTAHRLYPDLALPSVSLWLEETGYFERNGDARLLARRITETIRPAVHAVAEITRADGRDVAYHDRYLNKAFGQHRCPFLVHLAGDVPYLALGPNDPDSNIHAPDESLAIANLGIAYEQQVCLLQSLGGRVA